MAECVFDCKHWLGETPVWSATEGCLYWSDVPAYAVHRWNPASGEHRSWKMPEFVTAIATTNQGGLIIATTTGIDIWDTETDRRTRLAEPEANLPANRSNDGKCDRQGRFWLGTMYNNLKPDGTGMEIDEHSGNLYRIEADGSVDHVDGPFGIGNTLAWSPDDKTMYFADSLAGVYAYDFDAASGSVDNRRMFARTDDPSDGVPDGSAIDSDGFLWNCRWGGGGLIRWAPDGTIDRKVALPCAQVTSAAFGGPDLAILYVTSARHGLSDAALAEQPLAGGIFAIDAGVRGLPETPFGA